jgi:hypothetical protein
LNPPSHSGDFEVPWNRAAGQNLQGSLWHGPPRRRSPYNLSDPNRQRWAGRDLSVHTTVAAGPRTPALQDLSLQSGRGREAASCGRREAHGEPRVCAPDKEGRAGGDWGQRRPRSRPPPPSTQGLSLPAAGGTTLPGSPALARRWRSAQTPRPAPAGFGSADRGGAARGLLSPPARAPPLVLARRNAPRCAGGGRIQRLLRDL